ncbi:P-loop containing nucleoside triphosphate hydrolase protein [Phialemonium atrogriseum]|uniref:P-loop containing nucleoside triphosphate hydrolase protein n=1 Tax=Phialemonium atrogriseum TaxID=1093897 RepID=A0AAJ0BTR0_9PEZI|nr:P-loop containing nucleoside triphosphate hydrolase protein [Phialemonium atrogriseum]KAK1764125.1 P-loop containing nucleoside triphosphate hydrolase protein [Phialemonium atrogriseum]
MHVCDCFKKDVVMVLAGSVEGTTAVLGKGPQARLVFPRRIRMKDYDDEQLRRILVRMIARHSLKVEDGINGPYPRIAARRVGRCRDAAGFGNVHEVEASFAKMLNRQATRLREERARMSLSKAEEPAPISKEEEPAAPDEYLLTMQDVIGPEPEDTRSRSDAWKELQHMVGLKDIKHALEELMRRAKINYQRELLGKDPIRTSLNRVFLGPPGTGKTTVAKLYGRILAETGLLSARDVIYKTPADFIGQHLGDSEARTRGIIESAQGKVLIIDDAHMFYHGSRAGSGNESDEFRLSCIDVLVAMVHNRPGDDACVILIGYRDMMEEMFQKCNPGLRRRFPPEEAFHFADYDDAQLNEILEAKMAEEDIAATATAKEAAAEVLRRARDRPNFGNGGDVVNILNLAKARYRDRMTKEREKAGSSGVSLSPDREKVADVGDRDSHVAPSAADDNDLPGLADDANDAPAAAIVLEPEDFDPDYDRGARASQRCRRLFEGLIGFDGIIHQFEGYQRMAANMRLKGKDPRESIPFTYIFKGPPGTGKTHTARIIGQIFYDMGFLSTSDVVECSATHLVGQWVGHTGPKVVALFERALGKVLFIDEAYRLTGSGGGGRGLQGGGGSFNDEAIGELVDCMTKPRYLRKMIIVLAGYDREMDALARSNAGLRGRFATEVTFAAMEPARCLEHLRNLVGREGVEVRDEVRPTAEEEETVLRLFRKLGMTRGWSNGRDVKTLAGLVTGHVYRNIPEEGEGRPGGDGRLTISTKELIAFQKDMLRERIRGGRD